MKILVIEDDHKIATGIKKGLEQEGHTIDLAFDGEEGLDLAMEKNSDVIVLDLMLPKMNGIEVAKSLRKESIHTPILMLTAKGELSDKLTGFESGADDYLVKPFAFEELIARINAIARRPSQIKNSKLISNNLELNTNTFEVKKDGKEITLSKKEFQILEFLMKNEGRVISKEDIIARVWNYESDILPNTVEVFIGYLRNKIGKDMIKTIRGFGYKMSEN
jgi:DNA-binding response OmpR family regulator